MNLKQKTFTVVAAIVAGLLGIYVLFSNYYVRQQEKALLDERKATAENITQDFTEFMSRGVERLQTVAALPGLVYGLQNLEETQQGKQIPAWTTLHYLFYETDVFTDGVFLLDNKGKILWSEPPDRDLIETEFNERTDRESFNELKKRFPDSSDNVAFLLGSWNSSPDIFVGSNLNDADGQMVGMLVGAIPTSHPSIHKILQRNGSGHGTAQLVDESGLVIASTDAKRDLHPLGFSASDADSKGLLLTALTAPPSPWKIVIDQSAREAYTGIRNLKALLTAFGALFTMAAMGTLLFVLRSFTRPVEQLTAAAKRIGDGDLSGRFTLDRADEIGSLSKTLDDMQLKLKSSYDLLLQSEKMALMGQVIAGIAHELNNPLTIVIGNVQLMIMREVSEKNLQSLGRIKDGAERASKIVRNLLTFARQQKPERKPVDVNAVLKKSLELRAYELKVSNIEVSLDLASRMPETMADPHQLQQVFLNLIVNAEHAMLESHGKGLLRMSTRAENGRIMVFFSDDGPGIPPESLRRIFEPFYTTKPVGKGTGLGLSICQAIVGEHGGRIDVESIVGRGATFVVDLPVQRWTPPACPRPPRRSFLP
jgi:signal transduction histidine kinase